LGAWDGEPVYSTPLSIFYDITGDAPPAGAGMYSPWTF
jgi:hypothetical protein